jgi:hypothetical protein
MNIKKLFFRFAQLEVHTNAEYSDTLQSYYAGFIEGYLTHELISMHWNNKLSKYFDDDDEFRLKLKNFVETNVSFIKSQINEFRKTDPYWHNVALILEQITGLQDGYALHTAKTQPLGPRIDVEATGKVFLLNLIPDLDVLEEVLEKKSIDRLIGEGSCSAIIKLLKDGSDEKSSDLLVAHNMWSTYHSMLRLIKKYNFNFHLLPDNNICGKSLIAGHCMSFSSYPGAVLSLDDFYILSSGLVIQETTFEILNNESLWNFVKPNQSVFEFIRVIVSNRLSKCGQEWTQNFSKYNSGTYNSQWMIIDFNKFEIGVKPQQLQDNLLWICEQLPDFIHCQDVTNILREQEYWASYNIPYFKDIYNRGGYKDLKQKYGHYFSYKRCARALIFKRDYQKVTDLKSMMQLMRSNDFKNDPLSQYNKCVPSYSADLAIAARNDLNDPNGVYAIPVLGFRARGAIDAKITSKDMMKNYEMFAISGPTNQSLPTFQWSTSNIEGIKHEGQPDKWQFSPIIIKWFTHKILV